MEGIMFDFGLHIEKSEKGIVGPGSSTTKLAVTSECSVSQKRSSQFVRSDALSPNSVNKLMIESELDSRKPQQKSSETPNLVPKITNDETTESKSSMNPVCKPERFVKSGANSESRQRNTPMREENTCKERWKPCKSLEAVQTEPNFSKLSKQTSLESSLFKRKKMSQAEKHRGWIRMKNVSAVKISIQVLPWLVLIYLPHLHKLLVEHKKSIKSPPFVPDKFDLTIRLNVLHGLF